MVRCDLDQGFSWRAARGDWPRERGTKAYRHCGLAASMGPERPAISCQSADCELLSATGSGPLTVLGLEARRRSVIGDLSMLWNRGMASPSRDALGSRAVSLVDAGSPGSALAAHTAAYAGDRRARGESCRRKKCTGY